MSAPPVQGPSEVLAKLRDRKGTGTAGKPASGAAKAASGAPKMATPKTASKPKKPGKAIADALAMICKTIFGPRRPVHVTIIERQSKELPDILDKLYDEDEQVRKVFDWIGGYLGKGGAWGELAQWAGMTGAALAVASGNRTPLLQVIAAPLLSTCLMETAWKLATREAIEQGKVDGAGVVIVDPARVEYFIQALSSEPVAAQPT